MTNLSDKYKDSLPFDSSNITTITSNYTASNNETIFVNSASSALTVTLPASPTQGSKIKVLDIAANSQNNNISVLGNGNNIGGASAYIINTPDSSVEVMYINAIKGWNVLNEYISLTKPQAPTSISAVNVGTGRAYNNGAATVSFTPSTEGDAASSYVVTSTPGSYSATGTSSPIVITGLQSNISYTFKVYARNAAGNSTESVASGSITATTVPQAPTINSVTSGFEKVTVSFTNNNTGGSSIISNAVIPSGLSATTGSSPITVTGLTGGTSYGFTATATNANGTSEASSSTSSTPFSASGGDITTYTVASTNYRAHTFNSTSNFIMNGSSSCDVFVLAGGGGGGVGASLAGGPGGGAGGMQTQTITLSGATYAVVVGAGGGSNSSGTLSSISTVSSTGGGGGPGAGGGSGAGGNVGGGAGGLAVVGQGSNGATGRGGGQGGAGGGGKGGVGSGSNGGASSTNDYRIGSAEAYAGGGGGGNGDNSPAGGGVGGYGGGATAGAGGGLWAGNAGQPASSNTGSAGGGGLNYGNAQAGGNGGSGRVIVRYAV